MKKDTMLLKDYPRHCRGVSIVEILMAMVLLGLTVTSLASLMKYLHKSSQKFRDSVVTSDAGQMFFSRLNNIRYEYLFDVDSSSPNYGLTGTFGPKDAQIPANNYPYLGVLNDLRASLVKSGYDRFKIGIRFMVPIYNPDGTSQLRLFKDNDGDGKDDADPGIRYQDFNGDGDSNDFKLEADNGHTEQPDTHIKEVTLQIFRGPTLVHKEVQLISWEKFSGDKSLSSGAAIKLGIGEPRQNEVFFQYMTQAQKDAIKIWGGSNCEDPAACDFTRVQISTYPDFFTQMGMPRADADSPMWVNGMALPNADVTWKLGSYANPALETFNTGVGSGFNMMLGNLTNALQEGRNSIFIQATKNSDYSAWKQIDIMYDKVPPAADSETPTNKIHSRQPFVRVKLYDTTLCTGGGDCVPSGICPYVTNLSTVNSFTPFNERAVLEKNYDPGTGYVTWVDSSGFPAVLVDGRTYFLELQGGDNAMYKVAKEWSFQVELKTTPVDAPKILDPATNAPPIDTSTPNRQPLIACKLQDDETGIDLNSISIFIDDMAVPVFNRDSANFFIPVQPSFDNTGKQDGVMVKYYPGVPFDIGSTHAIKVKAKNWNSPQLEKVATWNITVCDPCAADTTPPVIGYGAPGPGDMVSLTFTILSYAFDNVGVVSVQYKVDGVYLGTGANDADNSYQWNTTLTPNGVHVLTAVAQDAAGNTGTASVSVTVSN